MWSTTIQKKQERFFASSQFAVIGASPDQSILASQVLGWYRDKHMDVIPVHPREKRLDGLHAIPSISKLPSPSTTALTISTTPLVTLSLLKQARALSIPSIWIQPGAADKHVIDYIEENNLSESVIWGGPCILQDGDHIIQRRWFDETYEGQSC
ncbi:NAD(P)-binding protein [Lyophyllum atratum]|nr:NAD(P)-binding protein [Lyophyllum atratum]